MPSEQCATCRYSAPIEEWFGVVNPGKSYTIPGVLYWYVWCPSCGTLKASSAFAESQRVARAKRLAEEGTKQQGGD